MATTLSNDVPEATEKSAEHSPAYFSPTIGSPRSGERAIPDGPDPPTPSETPVPVLPQEQREDTHLDVGKYLQQTFESLPEPSVTTQSDVDVPPAVTASTPLSLLCRICGAPPTVGTRPTATVCGHLFCSEYVLRILGSAAARFTLHQVHHAICDVDLQVSCVQQRSLVILSVQTRSPSVTLGIQYL